MDAWGGIGSVVEVVIIGTCVGKVDGYVGGAFRDDGFDEEASAAHIELIVDCKTSFIGWMDVELGLDDGDASFRSFVEGRVPCWEKLVAEADGLRDYGGVGVTDEIGLTAAGVNVGVGTEEGVEGAGLVPACEELGTGGSKEAANVGAGVGET